MLYRYKKTPLATPASLQIAHKYEASVVAFYNPVQCSANSTRIRFRKELHIVNIGAADNIDGRPARIFGLARQLIRVHALAQENLKVCVNR